MTNAQNTHRINLGHDRGQHADVVTYQHPVRKAEEKNYLIQTPWGIGIRGLMRGMATLPQGNQELLVVKDKVGKPPGELRVRKSMEYDIFPSVL